MILDVVTCESCKYMCEMHYEEQGESPYVKRKCMNKYGLNHEYAVCSEDFCSRGEKGNPPPDGNGVEEIFFDEEAFGDYYE